MKNIVFALISYFLHIAAMTAQENRLATFRLGFPNTGNQDFFAGNPAVTHAMVGFKADKPASVSLHFRAGHSELFCLASEEDKSLLNRRYGPFSLPLLPRMAINLMADMTGPQGENTYYDVHSTITKDSVFFLFSHWYKPDTSGNRGAHTSTGKIVPFPGDPELLKKIVSKKYRPTVGNTTNDSLYSFSGQIGEDGALLNIVLTTGVSSDFTDYLLSELRKAGNARMSGTAQVRTVKKGYIRIYARLNKDGTVTLLAPRRLRINGGHLPE